MRTGAAGLLQRERARFTPSAFLARDRRRSTRYNLSHSRLCASASRLRVVRDIERDREGTARRQDSFPIARALPSHFFASNREQTAASNHVSGFFSQPRATPVAFPLASCARPRCVARRFLRMRELDRAVARVSREAILGIRGSPPPRLIDGSSFRPRILPPRPCRQNFFCPLHSERCKSTLSIRIASLSTRVARSMLDDRTVISFGHKMPLQAEKLQVGRRLRPGRFRRIAPRHSRGLRRERVLKILRHLHIRGPNCARAPRCTRERARYLRELAHRSGSFVGGRDGEYRATLCHAN